MKGTEKVGEVEELLKQRGFEVDTRPPNIIRMTAHYGYIRFADVYQFVQQLKCVLDPVLHKKMSPTLTAVPQLNNLGYFKAEEKNKVAATLRGNHSVVYLHR